MVTKSITDILRVNAGSLTLRQWDALAYDKVSASPTQGTATESLLTERVSVPKVRVRAISTSLQRNRGISVLQGNVALPTAKLCPMCKLSQSCTCNIVRVKPTIASTTGSSVVVPEPRWYRVTQYPTTRDTCTPVY